MIVTISPSKAYGRMEAPPSKSMANRFLVCAGCAQGTSVISNIDLSGDIAATLDCLQALGAKVVFENRSVTIRGIDIRALSQSAGLNCAECGSTLRFMIPVCLMSGQPFDLTGSHTLFSRPLTVFEEICKKQNLTYEKKGNHLSLAGRLRPGEYVIQGNISSQFVSGLLFVLPLLQEDSVIRLLPPVVSRPYIDMTIQALQQFGVRVSWMDETAIRIPGGQKYLPQENLYVEGDYSNAAVFDSFNLLGGDVGLDGLNKDSLQGDRIYRRYFQQLQAGYADIDLSDCPDLGPVLMALAAALHGARFTGTGRLKFKESDRVAAMQQELGKMKVRMEVFGDEIRIDPGLQPPREMLDGHNDHRIVMALSVLLTVTGGRIRGAQAVSKSLPGFFERLKYLGIGVMVDETDQQG